MSDKTKLAKSIVALALEIEPLKKESRNDDAKFNFVSIDEYYAKVARLAMQRGIYWAMSELHAEPNGEYIYTTYNVELYDTEHNLADESFCTLSVAHPFQGAQTSGSSLSYAEKAFMRTAFKIVTGEPDGDHFAKPKSAYPGPSGKAAAPVKTGMAEAAKQPAKKLEPANDNESKVEAIKRETPPWEDEPEAAKEPAKELPRLPASKMDPDSLVNLCADLQDRIEAADSEIALKAISMKWADDLAYIKQAMPNENSILMDAYKKRRAELQQKEAA